MGKKFNAHVAVHKDPAETVWFAPGDDVPEWALDLVGDHVIGDAEEAEDVRLTDPENEEDDDETKWSTVNTLPPAAETTPDVDEDSDEDLGYEDLSKDDLKSLLEQRDLPVSGNKAELIARLEEDDAADEDDDTE
jgi:hypothetical protein